MRLEKLVTVETRNLRHRNGSHIRRRSVVVTFDGHEVGFIDRDAAKRLVPQALRQLAANRNWIGS